MRDATGRPFNLLNTPHLEDLRDGPHHNSSSDKAHLFTTSAAPLTFWGLQRVGLTSAHFFRIYRLGEAQLVLCAVQRLSALVREAFALRRRPAPAGRQLCTNSPSGM